MFSLTYGNKRAAVAAAVDMKKPLSPLAMAIAFIAAIAVASVLGGCSSSGVVSVDPKDTLEDYTWAELSAISTEIAAASGEDEAIEIAQTYNLVNEDGTLDGTQTKSVTLTDGTETSVQIVGFAHDDKSDGSGKAGITFIFTEALAQRSMNSDDDNSGGWESSEMRSWLASEGMDLLPEELQDVIVAVDKLTNNVGETEDVSSVTTTSDELWLFSYVELAGEMDTSAYNEQSHYMINIYSSEGSQYQLFSDCGVTASHNPNDILVKTYQGGTCWWWQRSPDVDYSTAFKCTYFNGNPYLSYLADNSYAVIPGFCI